MDSLSLTDDEWAIIADAVKQQRSGSEVYTRIYNEISERDFTQQEWEKIRSALKPMRNYTERHYELYEKIRDNLDEE